MNSYTNIELISQFCRDAELQGMTAESIVRYKSSLQDFDRFLMKSKLSFPEVDYDILTDYLGYLRDKELAIKTMENYFSSISSLFTFLEFKGLVPKNPVLAIRKRYLKRYKKDDADSSERKLLSVDHSGAIGEKMPWISTIISIIRNFGKAIWHVYRGWDYRSISE